MSPGNTDAAESSAPPETTRFRKHEYSPGLRRGLFTLFIDDEHGRHIAQVWATRPAAAASLMAPWSKGRLRRGHRHDEVPVELVGWDLAETPAELSTATDIPENELDPGCLGFGLELIHVWCAERATEDRTSTLYVVETIPPEDGMTDEP